MRKMININNSAIICWATGSSCGMPSAVRHSMIPCYHIGAICMIRQISSRLSTRITYGDGEGIENVVEYWQRRDLLASKPRPSRQWEIAAPPIPNSIFSGEGRGHRFHTKLTHRLYGACERPLVSPILRVHTHTSWPTFKQLATVLNDTFVGVIIWNCCSVSSSMSWNRHSGVLWVSLFAR